MNAVKDCTHDSMLAEYNLHTLYIILVHLLGDFMDYEMKSIIMRGIMTLFAYL